MVGFIIFPQLSVVAQLVDGQVAGFSIQNLIPCRGKSSPAPLFSPHFAALSRMAQGVTQPHVCCVRLALMK